MIWIWREGEGGDYAKILTNCKGVTGMAFICEMFERVF